jgi:hypothetical protein
VCHASSIPFLTLLSSSSFTPLPSTSLHTSVVATWLERPPSRLDSKGLQVDLAKLTWAKSSQVTSWLDSTCEVNTSQLEVTQVDLSWIVQVKS